jgi:hypothetical protein
MIESPGWQRLVAFEGGTVSWLTAAAAGNGVWHVFAATTVGVFRSVDGGRTWSPLGGASRVAGVEVVTASPRYAENGMVLAGAYDGLFRWQEDGNGWAHLLSGSRVLTLAVTPDASPARTDGSDLIILAGTETDGVLVSRDGGRTWDGANAGLLDLEVLALAVSPGFAQDGLAYAATPTAVYRTRNGAESWREIEIDSSALEDTGAQSLALSADFARDGVMLVGGLDRRLHRSDDRGRSWEQVPDLSECDVFGLTCYPEGRVVAATDQGVALSDDGGASWRLVGTDLDGVLGVAAIVDGPQTVLLAGLADRGVVRFEDGGETWTATNSGLAGAPFVGIVLSPDFERDQTLYAYGLQTATGVSKDGGQTWTMHDDDLESVIQVVALPDGKLVDATRPEAMWAKLSPPAGGGQIVAVGVSPEIDEQRDAAIYFATVGPGSGGGQSLTLWRTTNQGRRWDRWLEIPDVPGGSAVQVVALPVNRWDDTVLVGLGGTAYRPRQGSWQVTGGSRRPVWDAIALPGEAAAGRVAALTGLVASPDYARDRTVFAATSAGVCVSRDGGASFTPWSDGLNAVSAVAVAPSPAYAGDRLVFALGLGGTIWCRRDA